MCLTLEKFFPREQMAAAITVWPSRTPGALTYQITPLLTFRGRINA